MQIHLSSDQLQGTVALRNISVGNSGLYQCTASNAIGTSSCVLNLQVVARKCGPPLNTGREVMCWAFLLSGEVYICIHSLCKLHTPDTLYSWYDIILTVWCGAVWCSVPQHSDCGNHACLNSQPKLSRLYYGHIESACQLWESTPLNSYAINSRGGEACISNLVTWKAGGEAWLENGQPVTSLHPGTVHTLNMLSLLPKFLIIFCLPLCWSCCFSC